MKAAPDRPDPVTHRWTCTLPGADETRIRVGGRYITVYRCTGCPGVATVPDHTTTGRNTR